MLGTLWMSQDTEVLMLSNYKVVSKHVEYMQQMMNATLLLVDMILLVTEDFNTMNSQRFSLLMMHIMHLM